MPHFYGWDAWLKLQIMPVAGGQGDSRLGTQAGLALAGMHAS